MGNGREMYGERREREKKTRCNGSEKKRKCSLNKYRRGGVLIWGVQNEERKGSVWKRGKKKQSVR